MCSPGSSPLACQSAWCIAYNSHQKGTQPYRQAAGKKEKPMMKPSYVRNLYPELFVIPAGIPN